VTLLREATDMSAFTRLTAPRYDEEVAFRSAVVMPIGTIPVG